MFHKHISLQIFYKKIFFCIKMKLSCALLFAIPTCVALVVHTADRRIEVPLKIEMSTDAIYSYVSQEGSIYHGGKELKLGSTLDSYGITDSSELYHTKGEEHHCHRHDKKCHCQDGEMYFEADRECPDECSKHPLPRGATGSPGVTGPPGPPGNCSDC